MRLRTITTTAAVAALALGLPAVGDASSRGAAYAAARHIWKVTLCRAAYQQAGSWRQAARELDGARPLPPSYRVAADWLRTIASVPETSATPAQGRLFAKDAEHLDGFFHTPGLYVRYTGQCPIGS